MREFLGWLGASPVAALLLLATVARADEKNVPLAQVPREVREAVHNRFPGAQLTTIEKETENGAVVYDVELKHKGHKYEMDIKADGTILEIEKQVAERDLPRTAIRALKARYPGARIKEIMEVNKVKGKQETPKHYEVVLVTAEKKQLEVEVALDGRWIKGGAAAEEKK